MKENKTLTNQISELERILTASKSLTSLESVSLTKPTFKSLLKELQIENIRLSQQSVSLFKDNLQLDSILFTTQQEQAKQATISVQNTKQIQQMTLMDIWKKMYGKTA